MIETALGIITNELKNINVPYEFMRWTREHNLAYWVGEYFENPTYTEDGYEEGSLILTGSTTLDYVKLLEDRTKIKDHFPKIGGLRKSTDKGTVVIFYDNSSPVPTGEANLKRIQINLQIKMWKGMK